MWKCPVPAFEGAVLVRSRLSNTFIPVSVLCDGWDPHGDTGVEVQVGERAERNRRGTGWVSLEDGKMFRHFLSFFRVSSTIIQQAPSNERAVLWLIHPQPDR